MTTTATTVERLDGSPEARRFNLSMKLAIVAAFVIAIAVPLDHRE